MERNALRPQLADSINWPASTRWPLSRRSSHASPRRGGLHPTLSRHLS